MHIIPRVLIHATLRCIHNAHIILISKCWTLFISITLFLNCYVLLLGYCCDNFLVLPQTMCWWLQGILLKFTSVLHKFFLTSPYRKKDICHCFQMVRWCIALLLSQYILSYWWGHNVHIIVMDRCGTLGIKANLFLNRY